MTPLKKQSIDLKGQEGFTLLELVVVIAILSTMAWMSLEMVGNSTDQVRFDDTRTRLETIRKAIIGDYSRSVNGSPVISGYLADMGNFPETLRDLVVQGDQPDYTYNTEYGIWAGWRGPYLRATSVLDSEPKFRDGWGNKGSTEAEAGETLTEDEKNFGWYMPTDKDSAYVLVRSYGRDGEAGPQSVDEDYDVYNADYPPDQDTDDDDATEAGDSEVLVSENDYTVLVTDGSGAGGIPVDFVTPAGCWACIGAEEENRADCVGEGGTWKGYVYDAEGDEITNEASCLADVDVDGDGNSDGDGTGSIDFDTSDGNLDGAIVYLPVDSEPATEQICLKIAKRSEGGVVREASATPCSDGEQLTESDCGSQSYAWDETLYQFTWDGDGQTILFRFKSETRLPMGQLAYKIFLYDDDGTEAGCTDDEFAMSPGTCSSSGYFKKSDCDTVSGDWEDAEPWLTLTVVPGATLNQALEWHVE